MKAQILAGVTALALAAVMTISAMAFDRGSNFHAGRPHGGFNSSRLAGVRGFENWRQSGWSSSNYPGGYIDLGPLGITAACGAYHHKHGHCGPDYSVSAWSY